MADNPLIKIDGNLTEPLTRLIEKCCEGAGILYEPTRRKRLAKADAEVLKILEENKIEITEIQKRGFNRLLQEEGKKQENIESLLLEAGPHLKEDAKPEEIENDWIANLLEKVKIVSNKEMRTLWAKLLAGEANKPGSFSKRTVNIVGNLDKSDADLFTKFCSFTIRLGVPIPERFSIPAIYNYDDNLFKSNGINFDTLYHLDSIGLIKFQQNKFEKVGLGKNILSFYFDQSFSLELAKDIDNFFLFGQANFTKIGDELAPIANGKPIEGFPEYLIDQWGKLGYNVKKLTV